MNKVTGQDLVDLAEQHLGERYVLGALVTKSKKDHRGPWDCAELISWDVYQLTGSLYGCSDNNGDPDNPNDTDAYTGYWKRDVAEGRVLKIDVERAKNIPGAILLRYPAKGATGHIIFVKADRKSVEAHSTARGLVNDVVDDRRWDCGILIPGIDYAYTVEPMAEAIDGVDNVSAGGQKAVIVFRYTVPMMVNPAIGALQEALTVEGYDTKGVDDKYGPDTASSVGALQRDKGLVVDNEAGIEVFEALGIGHIITG